MAARNLSILFLCQMIAASGSILLVTLAGIVGADIAANPALATLPLSILVVGIAATTVPASLLMRRVGRRRGFVSGALVGCAGAVLVALALIARSFTLLCAATALYGMHMAFVQQYRFAAAESVPSSWVSRAISLVLLASIGGALLGPALIEHGREAIGDTDYLGTLLALAAALLVAAVALAFLRNPQPSDPDGGHAPPRPLSAIVRQPLYLIAVLCGAAGYGVMTFIMTATPLSMHVHDGFTMAQTSAVVRSHVVAMYAPSLVSGWLIERLGVGRMMACGAVLMLLTVGAGFLGREYIHYHSALIALGVGWNLLYVGGTTLLTRCYRASERFRAQAVNDFSVFALSAAASLLSGTIMQLFGWRAVMTAALPPLVAVLIAIGVLLGRRRAAPA